MVIGRNLLPSARFGSKLKFGWIVRNDCSFPEHLRNMRAMITRAMSTRAMITRAMITRAMIAHVLGIKQVRLYPMWL